MRKRHKNLQPWLDYFEMLHSYEENGYMNVLPEKHEAYVTLPALLTITGYDDAGDAAADRSLQAVLRLMRVVRSAVRRIRTYAGWKSQHGGDYLVRPFALHVVEDEMPHDLLCTMLLTRRRVWWKLWTKADRIEVIGYGRQQGRKEDGV